MVRNAVRGAGYHWGHAFETAESVRWLESVALPGTQVVAAYLQQVQSAGDQTDRTSWQPVPDPLPAPEELCPLLSSTTLVDHARLLTGDVHMRNLAAPLLLVPALRHLGRLRETSVSAIWRHGNRQAIFHVDTAGECRTNADAFMLTLPASEHLQLSLDTNRSPDLRTLAIKRRCSITQQTWELLDTFAAKTRAPATQSSRLLGAGAGVNDSD